MVTDLAGGSGYLWLVPGAPFAAFVVTGLVTRPWRRLSAALAVGAMSVSFLLSLGAFLSQLALGPGFPSLATVEWFRTGTLAPTAGLLLDPLSAVMLVVVTAVGLAVMVYSLGYMAREAGLSRYYAYLSLFCASMLGLVLAGNLLQLYVCWELVGMCSYLLIGFWYDRDAPAFAAKKAFVTTRLGDLGFLVGVILLATQAGSFEYSAIREGLVNGTLGPGVAGMAALLLFCGAVGKSAQVPLHVWLPDAMEGPTPVSALIHAATMVAAGVFMVARLFFVFAASPVALETVAVVGAVTALFGATCAVAQDDMKRVLAYSTMSQLGLMMMALGCGAMTAGMFHLFNHAFFKALLFLGAGSVIHALETNDIKEMGGLAKPMPWTTGTFSVGALALAGFFPLSGFFSKDAVLAGTLARSPLLFAAALAVSFLTAFYMGRLFFVAFSGKARSARPAHESGWTMLGPMVALAVLSVLTGWWAWGFAGFVFSGAPTEPEFHFPFAAMTQAVPLAGLGLAFSAYVLGKPDPDATAARFAFIHNLLRRRYYVDEAYDWVVDRVVMGFSRSLAWFDRNVVDGAVNGVGWLARQAGDRLRKLQTGRVQDYAQGIFWGVVVLLLLARLARAVLR